MVASVRCSCSFAILLLILGNCPAADDPSWRVEVSKVGKPATALVEVKNQGYGSAFCIHSSGLFLTNAHVVQPLGSFPPNVRVPRVEINLVLNPGLRTEKSYAAKVIRSDKALDLALLRIDGVKDLPVLTLGSDEKVTELEEVVAFGFPFGTALAPDRKEFPAVSINADSITSLRRKDDRLHRIQLDVALNHGNSGGPVLDKTGKVIGVVVAGHLGTGVNFAIPVSTVTDFVARPDIQFEPPVLDAANFFNPVSFEAQVLPILPSKGPFTVDLTLKPARGGKERTIRMQETEGKYRATAVPLPPAADPLTIRLIARFDNGAINATMTDRAVKAGDREVKLSHVRSVQLRPGPSILLRDGKEIEGTLSGMDAVPVQLGEQSLLINLEKATSVRFAPDSEANLIWLTLLVRQGEKEVLRQCEGVSIDGLLPGPVIDGALTGIKVPKLNADKVERKLAAPVENVVVGGGGRYVILHQPKLKKLAIFDVNAADVVGHIPVNESDAKFAAGMEDVVVVLPHAGTMERWNLKSLQRDVAVTMPVNGVIRSIAMGSASRGPLLVHTAAATEELSPASFALVNVETMRLANSEIKPTVHMTSFYRDLWHVRASANGKVFGMWCTSHHPTGMGAFVVSNSEAKTYFTNNSFGHVVPGPDGRLLFTGAGLYSPEL